LARFGDDLRVVAAGAGYERALGARVLKMDDTPIAWAHDLIYSLTAADETTTLREARANDLLTIGLVLNGTGVTRDPNAARDMFVDDYGIRVNGDVKTYIARETPGRHRSYSPK